MTAASGLRASFPHRAWQLYRLQQRRTAPALFRTHIVRWSPCLCHSSAAAKIMFHILPSGAALTEPDACSAQTSFISPVSRSRPLPCYRCPHRPPTHGTRFLCPTAARSASAGMALAWTARLLCKFLALMRRTRSQRCVLLFALLKRVLAELETREWAGPAGDTTWGAAYWQNLCCV